jgi:hypothetical protein
MSLRFVACVEAGRLEAEALLLCESIRHFGGAHAETPISAYRPRAGEALADSTRQRLDALGVELNEEPLNTEHAFYPIANKLHAAAHAEAAAGEDIVVLLDSDSVIIGQPDALELAEGVDAAVSPVGKAGDGSTGPGHKNEDYWERLYELAGADGRPFGRTWLTGDPIRAYWNAGLVATRRDAGLMTAWLELFGKLIDEGHVPERGLDQLDQLALAAVLAREPERVETLPSAYNYRITRRPELEGAARELDLADLVHVHYMKAFHVSGFLGAVRPPLRTDTPQFEWLAERLPIAPEIEVPPEPDGSAPGWRKIRRAAKGQLARTQYGAPPQG